MLGQFSRIARGLPVPAWRTSTLRTLHRRKPQWGGSNSKELLQPVGTHPIFHTHMFFFVGGVTPKVTSSDLPYSECPSCGALGTLQERRVDHQPSLFFIPVLTLHKGDPFVTCSRCGFNSLRDGGDGGGLGGRGEGAGLGGSSGVGDRAVRAQGLVCPHCGSDVQQGWAWCPLCGSAL